jgi:hypothetical protein
VAKEAIWYRRCSLYSLTKYSAIVAEVKGYFGIDGCNNQLAGKLRSLRFRLNNQLGFRTVVNNMREGFVCSLCFFKCWVPCKTDNQLVQRTIVEMGRGSSLKIICGLQVCICFDSLQFLLMHLLGSNNQLKGEWHFAFDSVET